MLAVAAFVTCWAGVQFGVGQEASVALGWAVLPFSVVLAVGGVWADNVRRSADGSSGKDQDSGRANKPRVVQKQRARNNARQLQVGHDVRVNDHDE